MLSWYIAGGALALWLVATGLYLRRPIDAWIKRKLAARAAARKPPA